jgi:hypothetical protein
MESKKIEDPCPAPLAGTHIDDAAPQKEISVDRLIKMIATAETYGLHDVGLDILFANQDRLGRRFDIEEAADWLASMGIRPSRIISIAQARFRLLMR